MWEKHSSCVKIPCTNTTWLQKTPRRTPSTVWQTSTGHQVRRVCGSWVYRLLLGCGLGGLQDTLAQRLFAAQEAGLARQHTLGIGTCRLLGQSKLTSHTCGCVRIKYVPLLLALPGRVQRLPPALVQGDQQATLVSKLTRCTSRGSQEADAQRCSPPDSPCGPSRSLWKGREWTTDRRYFRPNAARGRFVLHDVPHDAGPGGSRAQAVDHVPEQARAAG